MKNKKKASSLPTNKNIKELQPSVTQGKMASDPICSSNAVCVSRTSERMKKRNERLSKSALFQDDATEEKQVIEHLTGKGVIEHVDSIPIVQFKTLTDLEAYCAVSEELGFDLVSTTSSSSCSPFLGFEEDEQIRFKQKLYKLLTQRKKTKLSHKSESPSSELKDFSQSQLPSLCKYESNKQNAMLLSSLHKPGTSGLQAHSSMPSASETKINQWPPYIFKCKELGECQNLTSCAGDCKGFSLFLRLTLMRGKQLSKSTIDILDENNSHESISKLQAFIAASAVKSSPTSVLIPMSREMMNLQSVKLSPLLLLSLRSPIAACVAAPKIDITSNTHGPLLSSYLAKEEIVAQQPLSNGGLSETPLEAFVLEQNEKNKADHQPPAKSTYVTLENSSDSSQLHEKVNVADGSCHLLASTSKSSQDLPSSTFSNKNEINLDDIDVSNEMKLGPSTKAKKCSKLVSPKNDLNSTPDGKNASPCHESRPKLCNDQFSNLSEELLVSPQNVIGGTSKHSRLVTMKNSRMITRQQSKILNLQSVGTCSSSDTPKYSLIDVQAALTELTNVLQKIFPDDMDETSDLLQPLNKIANASQCFDKMTNQAELKDDVTIKTVPLNQSSNAAVSEPQISSEENPPSGKFDVPPENSSSCSSIEEKENANKIEKTFEMVLSSDSPTVDSLANPSSINYTLAPHVQDETILNPVPPTENLVLGLPSRRSSKRISLRRSLQQTEKSELKRSEVVDSTDKVSLPKPSKTNPTNLEMSDLLDQLRLTPGSISFSASPTKQIGEQNLTLETFKLKSIQKLSCSESVHSSSEIALLGSDPNEVLRSKGTSEKVSHTAVRLKLTTCSEKNSSSSFSLPNIKSKSEHKLSSTAQLNNDCLSDTSVSTQERQKRLTKPTERYAEYLSSPFFNDLTVTEKRPPSSSPKSLRKTCGQNASPISEKVNFEPIVKNVQPKHLVEPLKSNQESLSESKPNVLAKPLSGLPSNNLKIRSPCKGVATSSLSKSLPDILQPGDKSILQEFEGLGGKPKVSKRIENSTMKQIKPVSFSEGANKLEKPKKIKYSISEIFEPKNKFNVLSMPESSIESQSEPSNLTENGHYHLGTRKFKCESTPHFLELNEPPDMLMAVECPSGSQLKSTGLAEEIKNLVESNKPKSECLPKVWKTSKVLSDLEELSKGHSNSMNITEGIKMRVKPKKSKKILTNTWKLDGESNGLMGRQLKHKDLLTKNEHNGMEPKNPIFKSLCDLANPKTKGGRLTDPVACEKSTSKRLFGSVELQDQSELPLGCEGLVMNPMVPNQPHESIIKQTSSKSWSNISSAGSNSNSLNLAFKSLPRGFSESIEPRVPFKASSDLSTGSREPASLPNYQNMTVNRLDNGASLSKDAPQQKKLKKNEENFKPGKKTNHIKHLPNCVNQSSGPLINHINGQEHAVMCWNIPSLGYLKLVKGCCFVTLIDGAVVKKPETFANVTELNNFLNQLFETKLTFTQGLFPLKWVVVTSGIIKTKEIPPFNSILLEEPHKFCITKNGPQAKDGFVKPEPPDRKVDFPYHFSKKKVPLPQVIIKTELSTKSNDQFSPFQILSKKLIKSPKEFSQNASIFEREGKRTPIVPRQSDDVATTSSPEELNRSIVSLMDSKMCEKRASESRSLVVSRKSINSGIMNSPKELNRAANVSVREGKTPNVRSSESRPFIVSHKNDNNVERWERSILLKRKNSTDISSAQANKLPKVDDTRTKEEKKPKTDDKVFRLESGAPQTEKFRGSLLPGVIVEKNLMTDSSVKRPFPRAPVFSTFSPVNDNIRVLKEEIPYSNLSTAHIVLPQTRNINAGTVVKVLPHVASLYKPSEISFQTVSATSTGQLFPSTINSFTNLSLIPSNNVVERKWVVHKGPSFNEVSWEKAQPKPKILKTKKKIVVTSQNL